MRNRIRRAKRLLHVQSRLLLTERMELQTLRDALAEAQEQEQRAISLLNQDSALPPSLLIRRAVSSAAQIKSCEALLEAQVEKTLDHARREQLVKKKLNSAHEILSRHELKIALQTAIDAYLNSSLKQE